MEIFFVCNSAGSEGNERLDDEEDLSRKCYTRVECLLEGSRPTEICLTPSGELLIIPPPNLSSLRVRRQDEL